MRSFYLAALSALASLALAEGPRAGSGGDIVKCQGPDGMARTYNKDDVTRAKDAACEKVRSGQVFNKGKKYPHRFNNGEGLFGGSDQDRKLFNFPLLSGATYEHQAGRGATNEPGLDRIVVDQDCNVVGFMKHPGQRGDNSFTMCDGGEEYCSVRPTKRDGKGGGGGGSKLCGKKNQKGKKKKVGKVSVKPGKKRPIKGGSCALDLAFTGIEVAATELAGGGEAADEEIVGFDEEVASNTTSPDKKTAFVSIENKTPREIVNVTVLHKYSSVYKNQHTWAQVGAGATTGEGERMPVDYHHGFGFTGWDWWTVTWVQDGKTYVTDPNNFRWFVDQAETTVRRFGSTLAGCVGAAVGAAGGSVVPGAGTAAGGVAGNVAASLAADLIIDSLLSSEETAGFKAHVLNGDDEGQTTTISIGGDGSVTFRSPSGESSTVSKEIWSPEMSQGNNNTRTPKEMRPPRMCTKDEAKGEQLPFHEMDADKFHEEQCDENSEDCIGTEMYCRIRCSEKMDECLSARSKDGAGGEKGDNKEGGEKDDKKEGDKADAEGEKGGEEAEGQQKSSAVKGATESQGTQKSSAAKGSKID